MPPMTSLCRWDTEGRALDCPAYADPGSTFGYCAAHEAMLQMAREFLRLRDQNSFEFAAAWAIEKECDPAELNRLAKQVSRGRRRPR
jgi:hypothetical protein